MYVAERFEKYALVEPRIERIGSTEYAMASPGYKHQNVLLAIGAQLREKLSAHGCMTIIAPFDVHPLYDKGDQYTLVQPDIFLACDHSKLQDKSYNGAPQFIIEILSTNRSHEPQPSPQGEGSPLDMITKLNLYEKAGVSEYWIIDPETQIISVMELIDNRYTIRSWSGEDEIPLATIPGCTVDFKKVF